MHVSSTAREIVFHEAVDCFCGMVPKANVRNELIDIISRVWDVPVNRVQYFVSLHKPELRLSKSVFSVGRVGNITVHNKVRKTNIHIALKIRLNFTSS
jgi:midasin